MLTDVERDILTFERCWWGQRASKDDAIRASFGLDTAAYYRTLNTLLDRPAAVEHDPLLVRRLRRLRSARIARRRSA